MTRIVHWSPHRRGRAPADDVDAYVRHLLRIGQRLWNPTARVDEVSVADPTRPHAGGRVAAVIINYLPSVVRRLQGFNP